MSAPESIKALVGRFERNEDEYLRGYNEAQVRQEFINPLFRALGWDVENLAGRAEAYKEVIHEDQVAVAGVKKAPDYSFRIGGVRKFFVEAKRPSVDIDEDPAPAFQLRRYGWSAKLPVSILTNFRQLAVCDCSFARLASVCGRVRFDSRRKRNGDKGFAVLIPRRQPAARRQVSDDDAEFAA